MQLDPDPMIYALSPVQRSVQTHWNIFMPKNVMHATPPFSHPMFQKKERFIADILQADIVICTCLGNFYGVDCTECVFGWPGKNCETKKNTSRSFGSLSNSEKQNVANGIFMLKGYWRVVTEQPCTNCI